MIRITSFNLNGFGFVNSNIPFQQYLESFDADIICFQEIKKTKSGLRPEHINVPGWIACYSFANSHIYGVSTYIRATMTHLIPRHLEENICVKDSLIGGGKLEGLNFMEQIEVNSESGRVLISDHGSFVLFNIYAPSLVDVVHHLETRLDEENAKSNKEYTKTLINLQSNKEHTKALFNYALRERVDNLIEMGRKVVVVGDLNITHKPIDTFNPDVQQEGEKQDMYNKQQFRRWLSDWLNGVTREGRRGKKKVIDTFRHFYPDKRDEYTRYFFVSPK
jgi:AP endonuclease-2